MGKDQAFFGDRRFFFEAYSDLGGQKTYYKLSNFDNTRGIVGHECVNELIVDRLLTILGIEHLSYQLIHADIVIRDTPYTTWLCASQDFKQPRESKIAFDVYYEAEHAKGESPLDFCERNGWTEFIDQMLVVDYLILNRDRHGANIEVLRNSRKKHCASRRCSITDCPFSAVAKLRSK